jgi:hypothetical protein
MQMRIAQKPNVIKSHPYNGMHMESEAAALKDSEIRRQLVQLLHQPGQGRLVQELVLMRGLIRVDIAVISSVLHGFEIKSDRDTLNRLPAQKMVYGKVFDRMTLVVGPRHLRTARRMVPSWWGIWLASLNGLRVVLSELRMPGENPKVCVKTLAQLLWREEAVNLLALHGVRHIQRKSRAELCQLIATEIPLLVAKKAIAEILAERSNWRLQ